MHHRYRLAGALAATALLVAPALAQQQPSTPAPAPAPSAAAPPPGTAATAAPMPSAETINKFSGTLQKSHDEWRASKLVGQTVYDQNGQSIGTVDELMLDDSGRISQAVISVGGFLGIGSKLVAVPFDQLKFQQNQSNAAGPAATATTAANTTATNAAAMTAGGGSPTQAAVVPNTTPARYFSVVMPGADKNTLTSMSEFRYAG